MSKQTEQQLESALSALGNQIKRLRESAELSQKDFAEKCGLDQAQLSRMEAGKMNFTISSLLQIANTAKMALDVRFSKL